MTQVVIVGASRTPIGNFGGALASLTAPQLGKIAVHAALQRAGVSAEDVDDVILGQVLTAASGQNPARQTAIAAGIPSARTALTINQVCGSGLRAVALATQAIKAGDATIVVAGGQESMSQATHAILLRNGLKLGHGELIDTIIKDGLWDAFNDYHMGTTAENVASRYQISRQVQDELAVSSHQRAIAAQERGYFDAEIVPVTVPGKKGDTVVQKDERPRADTSMESLSKLKPAFDKAGSVTAGNASGINDGAAALVLMSAAEARRRKLEPLATVVSWATAGVDPAVMGTGPIPASRRALEKANWAMSSVDLIEANEAFAAQACAVAQGLELSSDRVNVNGGAIALGHPIGASGARVLVTLLHELKRRGARRGLATLCIGGGMGIALCVERD